MKQMDEYINKTKFEELMRKKARSNFDLYYADKSKHYHDNAIGYSIAADEVHVFPSTDVQPIDVKEILKHLDSLMICVGNAYNTSHYLLESDMEFIEKQEKFIRELLSNKI